MISDMGVCVEAIAITKPDKNVQHVIRMFVCTLAEQHLGLKPVSSDSSQQILQVSLDRFCVSNHETASNPRCLAHACFFVIFSESHE